MILRGVQPVGEGGGPREIVVAGRRIAEVRDPSAGDGRGEGVVALEQTIAFPGLTNSHDHLEFNLYPALARGPYADYVEWADDVQRHDRETIAVVEQVARDVRMRWGALKNLVCGFTTVAHHGEGYRGAAPLAVQTTAGTALHSVRLGRRWRRTLNGPRSRPPYVIHLAEGRSAAAGRETDQLLRWNLLRRPLVAVHAIAMPPDRASRFRAIVWCPVSNELLYGMSADAASWQGRTTILFGSDSTISADWNLWNHLRRARALGALDDRALFDAVTGSAARVWGRPPAVLRAGAIADVVVARKKAEDAWDAFFALEPEDILLVLIAGAVVLCDASLEGPTPAGHVSRVRVGSREKLVSENVPEILEAIRRGGVPLNWPLALAE